jgi:prolyl 4-hydroxylase
MQYHSNLPTEWTKWVEENLSRGCTHESIIQKLLENNFDFTTSKNSVSLISQGLNHLPEEIEDFQTHPYQYEKPRISFEGNRIKTTDRDVLVSLRVEKPTIAIFDDLLSADECNELIRLSEAKLTRSAIVDPRTGESEVLEARSSYGTFFAVNENDFIAKLDKRIAAVMNWPVENGEGIQILNYKIGGEYKPHFDYFPQDDSGSAPHLKRGGQRVSTLIMYLNDVEEAGETIFPTIGLSVTPKKGSALYFEYCNSFGQVDPLTLHGGTPVKRGSKWIATKWMRQNTYQ